MLKRFLIAFPLMILSLAAIDRASLLIAPCREYRSAQNNYDGTNKDNCAVRESLIVAGVERLYETPPEVWTALATIAIAAFTLTLWLSSEKMWKISQDTLVVSNRPWVSILSPSVISQLTWEDKGARVTICITIRNVGKSPAFDIAVEAHQFVIGPDNYDTGAALNKFCGEVRRRQIAREASGQKGEVLFLMKPFLKVSACCSRGKRWKMAPRTWGFHSLTRSSSYAPTIGRLLPTKAIRLGWRICF
jgi:hypothetical protein